MYAMAKEQPREHLLTPREIGRLLGFYSATRVNRVLQALGYQWRDENGDWRLADKGIPYGREFVGYTTRRTAYVRWRPAVIEEVRRVIQDGA